jgi:hypothetical protein
MLTFKSLNPATLPLQITRIVCSKLTLILKALLFLAQGLFKCPGVVTINLSWHYMLQGLIFNALSVWSYLQNKSIIRINLQPKNGLETTFLE